MLQNVSKIFKNLKYVLDSLFEELRYEYILDTTVILASMC